MTSLHWTHVQWVFATSQFFGVAATIFNIVKFTRNGRRSVLLWGRPVSVCFASSQLLCGEPQGATMSAIGFFAGLFQAFLGKHEHVWLRRAVMCSALIAGLAICPPDERAYSWLPFAVFVLARIGESFASELTMRSVWLFGTLLWLVYFVVSENYALMVSELVVLSISAVKIRRLIERSASSDLVGEAV